MYSPLLDRARRALRNELAACWYLARRAHPTEDLVYVVPSASSVTVHLGLLPSSRSAESAQGRDLADAVARLTAKLTRKVARVEARASL